MPIMKNKLSLIIILLFFINHLYSQETTGEFILNAGATYGGAIPTEMDTASYGAGLPGIIAGISYKFNPHKKFSIKAGILYNIRRFKYGTTQKEDTVVNVDISGDGNKVSIPTYYTAVVEGKAVTHHIDFRIPVIYRFHQISSAHLGVYGSWVFAGKDEATANVQIGEGSIIEDVEETSDAFESINSFEFGIVMGGNFYLNDRLVLTFEGIRALTPYYEKGYYSGINKGDEIKFYQTYGIIRLNYTF